MNLNASLCSANCSSITPHFNILWFCKKSGLLICFEVWSLSMPCNEGLLSRLTCLSNQLTDWLNAHHKTDLTFTHERISFRPQIDKQAMVKLQGMAEHRFSNVYNELHFTLLWYLYKCFSPFSPYQLKKVNNNDGSLAHPYKYKVVSMLIFCGIDSTWDTPS